MKTADHLAESCCSPVRLPYNKELLTLAEDSSPLLAGEPLGRMQGTRRTEQDLP